MYHWFSMISVRDCSVVVSHCRYARDCARFLLSESDSARFRRDNSPTLLYYATDDHPKFEFGLCQGPKFALSEHVSAHAPL